MSSSGARSVKVLEGISRGLSTRQLMAKEVDFSTD